MDKLTFKEFIQNSKDQLVEAANQIPESEVEYEVRRYCRLPVSEGIDAKLSMSLKPKQKVYIRWLHEDVENPTPIGVRLGGLSNVDNQTQFDLSWKSSKVHSWLEKNTRIVSNIKYDRI